MLFVCRACSEGFSVSSYLLSHLVSKQQIKNFAEELFHFCLTYSSFLCRTALYGLDGLQLISGWIKLYSTPV